MKRLSCKCGSTKHKNTNNPDCSMYTKKERLKPAFCQSCKLTSHFRKSNKLCPNHKVCISFHLFILNRYKKIYTKKDYQTPEININNSNCSSTTSASSLNNHFSKPYLSTSPISTQDSSTIRATFTNYVTPSANFFQSNRSHNHIINYTNLPADLTLTQQQSKWMDIYNMNTY